MLRIQPYPESKESFTATFIGSRSGSLILGRQSMFSVFKPGQSCIGSLHLLRRWHCCLHYTVGPGRPQQGPDISRTTGESGAAPHRHVGLATTMDVLPELHESHLDESTAERKQIVENTGRCPGIHIHISKLNVPAGIFLTRDRDGGYTGCTSARGLLVLLTTAFFA